MEIVYATPLSFQPADEHGVPTGDPEVVQKGQKVPDYVPPFVRNALLNAGVIVQVADDLTDEQVARRFAPAPEAGRPLPNPEQPFTPDGLPPLFNLSGDPDAHGTGAPAPRLGDMTSTDADNPVRPEDQLAGGPRAEDAGSEPAPGVASVAEKPSTRDPKQAWEDYAVATGVDRAEAESKTKAELIAEVEGRENA